MRILIGILITVTIALGNPVERKKDGPMVVDVPAGIFDGDTDVDDAIPLPTFPEKEVEVIQPEVPSSDSVEIDGSKKTDTDDLGSRVPTIFIIRRPVISDRFPFFQQSPFFGPSSFFENRRPLIQPPRIFQQERNPVAVADESDHDMISHMEQMMKRMQQQMSSLWGSFANPSFHRRPLRPIFPSLSFESDEDNNSNDTTISIDNLPPNYSNSTSETKVVDGHVVQVNKTIHKISSGNNNSGFFHFEVINVRPTEGAKTDEPEAPLPDAGVKPVVEIPVPESVAETQPPKAEDPSLNEVGGVKPIPKDEESVSGVDSGLLVDEPKPQIQVS